MLKDLFLSFNAFATRSDSGTVIELLNVVGPFRHSFSILILDVLLASSTISRCGIARCMPATLNRVSSCSGL